MENFDVIGLMSGTSLDGLDILHCIIKEDNGQYSFELLENETFKYDNNWVERLKNAHLLSGEDLCLIDAEYGHLLGDCIAKFNAKYNLKPLFVAVHGHTVFHQPTNSTKPDSIGFTTQIGDGSAIAAKSNCCIINSFRNKDVALGGQGAPLVPIGDKLLFPQYDFCLNLGGFSNISFDNNKGERIAFDISPCNMLLNYICETINLSHDDNGNLAKSGTIIPNMLKELNTLKFYDSKPPKSLGKEWFVLNIEPILLKYLSSNSVPDILRTGVEHIASQIAKVLNDNNTKGGNAKVLISGGGVFNALMLEKIKEYSSCEICIGSKELIEYKEALIFALLGVLRYTNKVNCLFSVSGGRCDSVGGAVWR